MCAFPTQNVDNMSTTYTEAAHSDLLPMSTTYIECLQHVNNMPPNLKWTSIDLTNPTSNYSLKWTLIDLTNPTEPTPDN
jgi:hypothetical protein